MRNKTKTYPHSFEDRRKLTLKKSAALAVILLLMCVCFIEYCQTLTKNAPMSELCAYTDSEASEMPVGELFAGDTVTQTFVCAQDSLGAVRVKLATYDRVNTCILNVRLLDESGTLVEAWSIEGEELLDNRLNTFELDNELQSVLGKRYSLVLSTQDTAPGNAIACWATDGDGYDDGELSLNGKSISGDIVFETAETDERGFVMMTMLFVFALLVCGGGVAVLIFYFDRFDDKKRCLSLTIIAGCLGILYMFMMTPLSPPDCYYHTISAYKLSNRLLLRNVDTFETEIGIFSDFVPHQNTRSGYTAFLDGITAAPGYSGEQMLPGGRSDSLAYPILYIVPALGVTFSRLLHLNGILVFYSGRVCNLLLYAIMLYFSLRRMPERFKPMLWLVAVMPMTLQQAASYSYDVIINALAFFFIATVLYSTFEKGRITRRELLPIIISSILLAPTKIVYTFLALLVLLIPKERFKSVRSKLIASGGIFGASALAMVIANVTRLLNVANGTPTANATAKYSLGYVFRHPYGAWQIFKDTLAEKGVWYIETAIGRDLSGLSLRVTSDVAIIGIAVLLILSAVRTTKDKTILPQKSRLIILGTEFILVVLILLSMFTAWTPLTLKVVEGVQGRYFIPILIPLLLLLDNDLFSLKRNITKPLMCLMLYFEVLTVRSVMMNMIVSV